jgi:hypothetical protein
VPQTDGMKSERERLSTNCFVVWSAWAINSRGHRSQSPEE